MLFVLSPAKSLDFDSAALTDTHTQPVFTEDSSVLNTELKKLNAGDISSLMGVSDAIAELNVERNNEWNLPFDLANSKQAVYAFKGDVYTGIAIETAEQKQVDYIQDNVLILSGLYGILRPLDLMQAYRLEMGTKFENPRGKNLYQFWGDSLTDHVNGLFADQDDPVLVNLASNEYYKALKAKNINARIVTPVFKDLKKDVYKIVSFYAKKARGLMVRYAADNAVTDPEGLKGFDYEGYAYNESLSSADEWVFTRDQPPAK